MPPEIADSHEEGPDFSNPDEKLRRKKRAGGMWQATEAGEIARVSAKKVLADMRQSAAVGGMIFNPYDAKRSLALARFLI